MLDKIRTAIYSRLFPCHCTLMALFRENAESVERNTRAREHLQAVCMKVQR